MINFLQDGMNWAYWLVVVCVAFGAVFGFLGNHINEIKKQNVVRQNEKIVAPAVFKIKNNSSVIMHGNIKTDFDTLADVDTNSSYEQKGNVEQIK